jgi:hypothetical protein
MDLPFCPACGSVRLAEEGGRSDGQVYHRIRCRDCLWAEPLAPDPVRAQDERDTAAPRSA